MSSRGVEPSMIARLILKDWYFHRVTIAFTFVLGAIALACVGSGRQDVFYMGSILYLTVLIGLGITLVLMTVIYERKEQTLPFIMSLPVSATQYTVAKILANLSIFMVPWTGLVVGSTVLIVSRDVLPNGLIPFSVLVSGELFATYCLILGVALVTESEGWTIGVIVACNLFLNYFMYVVSKLPGIESSMESESATWGTTFWTILGLEIAAAVVFVAVTFFLQARKRDFL